MTNEQRLLLTEIKEFMEGVHNGEWDGPPERRDRLVDRLNSAMAEVEERDALVSGLRGVLRGWLDKNKR